MNRCFWWDLYSNKQPAKESDLICQFSPRVRTWTLRARGLLSTLRWRLFILILLESRVEINDSVKSTTTAGFMRVASTRGLTDLRCHHFVSAGSTGQIQGMLQLFGETPYCAAWGHQARGFQSITLTWNHCRKNISMMRYNMRAGIMKDSCH